MATYTDQLVVYSGGSLKKVGDEETVEIHGIELTSSVTVPEGGLTLGSTAVTSTATELNILDGVTATTAELNILDGVTATATELNYLAGITLGTSAASKVVTADSSGDVVLSGNLTVSGTTTTISSTNTVVADKLFELGNGTTGTPSGDAGIIIERGDSDNAIIAWDESDDVFVLGTTTATGASSGDLTITAEGLSISALTLNGTLVTSTASELNILDGVTASATELNLLDGVTATTAELNILDGVTATAAELNLLDGVTASTAELNILDGDTSASGVTIVDADRLILNDDGTMVQVAASTLKTYFQTNVTASEIAADDIEPGDGSVTIETSSGSVDIKDFGQGSTQLTILSSNTTENFVSGNIVTLAAGGSGGLRLADKGDVGIWPAGVAIEASSSASRSGSAANIDVVTVHGSKVSVTLPSSNIDMGAALYLGDSGEATVTAPTAGQVWRLGFSTQDHSLTAVTSCEIIWMPQFIADLG